MSIKKYFWSLNEKALKEVEQILKDPQHPKFLLRAYGLLSRCDDPKEIWKYLGKQEFVNAWPRLRRFWTVGKGGVDFKAWWETVYEQVSRTKKPIGAPSAVFASTGKLIRAKRLEKGISQQDFASLAGMSQPDISAIEAGKKNITLETLGRLCKILGIKNIPFN